MVKTKCKQMSESLVLGCLLAAAGGYLDSYTYIIRGGVFANAQTGNIILFGLNIADGNMGKAIYYGIPILAFILGVILSEVIRDYHNNHRNHRLHWRQVTILIEMFVVAAVGFLPRGDFDMVANVAISFVCSLQVESFRKIEGNAFATTMCTGNLRSATEQLYRYIKTGDRKSGTNGLKYYGIIVCFILGAVMGMSVSRVFLEKAVWLCGGLLLGALLLMSGHCCMEKEQV